MPRNKTIKEEEKEVEGEEDPSPKKITSDDEEVLAEDIEDPLLNDEEDEDDPLGDFMPEEESW